MKEITGNIYGNFITGEMYCNVDSCEKADELHDQFKIKKQPMREDEFNVYYENKNRDALQLIAFDYFSEMIHHIKDKHTLVRDRGIDVWDNHNTLVFNDNDLEWPFFVNEDGSYDLDVYKLHRQHVDKHSSKINKKEQHGDDDDSPRFSFKINGYKLLNANVGPENVEKMVNRLKEQKKLEEDDIMVRENKKGNFAIWYKC